MAPWTQEEEMALVIAYNTINNQAASTSRRNRNPQWGKVLVEFNRLVGGTQRTCDSLSHKYGDLKSKCKTFDNYFKQEMEAHGTDTPEETLIMYAKVEYAVEMEQEFNHVLAWQTWRAEL